MNGMDRRTGRLIEGDAHLAQSVADILTTPVGSRLQRRTYGSLLPELLDQRWPLARRRATATSGGWSNRTGPI